jgi:hypothetical protein
MIDTSSLDVKPIWEFIGLEDVRLVRWDNRLYACGVRRDTTTNGQGRMELSELEYTDNSIKEISRNRIPAPPPDQTYCEKNWMPVSDMPYHFVKWCNPTEVVHYNFVSKETSTFYLDKSKYVAMPQDFRGGSQVIPLANSDYRFTCVHTVNLYKSEAGRKNARYRHCFVVWDKDWNVVKYTDQFSFMNAEIEFCTGMAEYGDSYLMTFGYQDNSAYILQVPKHYIEKICLT